MPFSVNFCSITLKIFTLIDRLDTNFYNTLPLNIKYKSFNMNYIHKKELYYLDSLKKALLLHPQNYGEVAQLVRAHDS